MNTQFVNSVLALVLLLSSSLAAQAQYFTYKGAPLATEQRIMLAQNKPLTWEYSYPTAPLSVTLKVTVDAKSLSSSDVLHVSWGNKQLLSMAIQLENMEVAVQPDVHAFGQYIDYFTPDYGEGTVTYDIRFRYVAGDIYMIASGEVGGDYLRQIGIADDFNFTLEAETSASVTVSYLVQEYDMPRMVVLAEGGLRMRSQPNLDSEVLALIPDGTTVMVPDAAHMREIHFEEMPNTQGTMKVGDLKSKMMPVFYEGKLGYVYGGYLFPVWKEDDEYGLYWYNDYNGWFIHDQEVAKEEEVYLRRFVIDFTAQAARGMDASQRAYLLTRLFPDVWERAALYKLLQTPPADAQRDGDIATYKLTRSAQMADKKGKYTLYFDKGIPVQLAFESERNPAALGLPTSQRFTTASSLNMRTTLDTKSAIQSKIPFGAAIQLLNRPTGALQVIGGVQGRMVWVNYQGTEGTVFDAYLSPIDPAQISEDYLSPSEEWMEVGGYNAPSLPAFETDVYLTRGNLYPARDIHQLLKTFRERFPMLEEVSITYDPAQKDYTIRSQTPKVEYHRAGNIHLFKLDSVMIPVIILESLGDGLWYVALSTLESGC